MGIYYFRTKLLNLYQSPRFHPTIIGIQGMYTTNNLPSRVTDLISYGLTVNTDNDRPQISPLVISYESQNNHLEYLFNLKPDLFWHSGKKLKSNDINYQFSGINFEAISDNLLKVTLEKPFSPLLSLLSQPLFQKQLNGLGPYKVKNLRLKESYVRSLELVPQDTSQPNLIFKFYPNEADLITAFQLGEVDEIETSQIPPKLTQTQNINITPKITTSQRYLAIFINTQRLQNKQTRQSLAYATPKTREKSERCLGPISTSSWAYNPNIKEYNFNPTRAKELFKDDQVKQITLSILDRQLISQAESIKESWEKILPIKVKIVVENQLNQQKYDLLLAYGGIPHDPDQYYFWHSTQNNTNITKLNNSRIDKLLEEGRQTYDPVERKNIYFDFQKYLLEESPAIFLNYPTTYIITRIK